MNTITAYRVGSAYLLDAPDEAAEPVTIVLADGVRLGRSASGERLLYRDAGVYGLSLMTALALGWCRVEPSEP